MWIHRDFSPHFPIEISVFCNIKTFYSWNCSHAGREATLRAWTEPLEDWSCSLNGRVGPRSIMSRCSNGSGRAGIGWEFGRIRQRNGTRHKKRRERDGLLTSVLKSSWLLGRKSSTRAAPRKAAIVALRSRESRSRRMTEKRRPAKLSPPGLFAAKRISVFSLAKAERRGRHATAHRARSNRARCPEATEPEQTLRKPPSQSTTTALCCLCWAIDPRYLVFLLPFPAPSRKNKESVIFHSSRDVQTDSNSFGFEETLGHVALWIHAFVCRLSA